MPTNPLSRVPLGHLARAPLVYTLGMVEFAQIPKMDSYAPDILENLRADYPEVANIEYQTWVINIQSPVRPTEGQLQKAILYSATTADKSWGIAFDNTKVVLHTKAYEHFQDFSKRFEKALKILTKTAKITHTRRIGIRYIDNIKKIESVEIQQQVKEQFLTPVLTDWLQPMNSFIEHRYRSGSGEMILRSVFMKDSQGIPPDLTVTANTLFNGEPPLAPILEPILLVDTDHSHAPQNLEQLDISRIMSTLDKLHDGASMAFREVAKPEAIELWRK